jgi:flavin reductase (DIM6/NTAB) family NADH-FMN oxidoreductase RutF
MNADSFTYFDLEKETSAALVRWVQPPQIIYFVTTIDSLGNQNTTPVTMGTCVGPLTHYAFALSNLNKPNFQLGDRQDLKHAYLNLKEVPECVISYAGYAHLRESWITGLPLPRGISEMEVAGFTPLPSQKVRPSGIRECAVNLEAKVVDTRLMEPFHTLYICDIVGMNIDTDMLRRNETAGKRMGVMAIDPIFEVLIDAGETGNTRLYAARMDPASLEKSPEDFGTLGNVWIGTYERWLDDEQTRGKLNETEKQELLALRRQWEQNRDPVANAALKDELTRRLRKLVEKPD